VIHESQEFQPPAIIVWHLQRQYPRGIVSG
jgi:hypothetical protein